MSEQPTTKTIVHAFEQAGLGKAPFRFVGCEILPGRGGGCRYCGTAIKEAYHILSSDGRRFIVGCDCVRKTGDAGLIDLVERESRRLATQARHAREEAKIAELRALLHERQDFYATLPHPRGFEGRSLLDYAGWMWRNSGNAGKLKLLKILKEVDVTGAVVVQRETDEDYEGRCDGIAARRAEM